MKSFSLLRLELDKQITYGSKQKALKIARQALQKALETGLAGEAEYFRGQSQMLKGNFSQAIRHFDSAIKNNPHDGASYNDRALCMVELGIIDEAFVYFDKGILVEPDYANIYHNKGWLLNNIGRHKEAIKYLKKALELDPDRPVTYDNLADAFYNLYDYAKSVEAYKKVLQLLKPDCCQGIKKQIKKKINFIQQKINQKNENH